MDTGWLSPGTVVDDDSIGTFSWSNPSNAVTDDGSYASTDGFGADIFSHYLKATNFGASIPNGATVVGIEVRINRKQEREFEPGINDYLLYIVKGGNIGTDDKASGTSWPLTDAHAIYGSSSLWGETWIYSDINASDFGVVLSVYENGLLDRALVDHIQIKVHYEPVTGPFPTHFRT